MIVDILRQSLFARHLHGCELVYQFHPIRSMQTHCLLSQRQRLPKELKTDSYSADWYVAPSCKELVIVT